MKYATVEDVIARFTHPAIPIVQGEPDYQTIHAIRKSLQANSRAIDTHLGGVTLGHMGLIVSDASYAMIAPATGSGPTFWISP
jgi:phage gp36-like protein